MHLSKFGGYFFLILLGVLAPTPIPVPLDGAVLELIHLGYNPPLIIFIAIVGDIIGTLLIFVIGKKGRDLYNQLRQRKKRKDYIIAQNLFSRFGKYSLLLSGVPFLGDALIFISGFYRLSTKTFIFWFILGKILWYGLVIIPIVMVI